MVRKYKCISANEGEFTVGKVYETKEDGRVIGDDGFVWFRCGFDNACEWCNAEAGRTKFQEVTNTDNITMYECIKSSGVGFTEGKIYVMDNKGSVVDDFGSEWASANCANAIEWLHAETDYRFAYVNKKKEEKKNNMPIEPMPKITVKVEGNKTIAKMWVKGKLVKERWCVCHESDKFDYQKGVQIAVARLFDWDYARRKVDE